MKKFVTFILVCVAVIIGFKVAKGIFDKIRFNAYLERVKEGWYVEVTTEVLNVRDEPKYNAHIVSTVKKGEIFKATDYVVGDDGYYWFYIDLYDGGRGWVANPKKKKSSNSEEEFLISHNNVIDVSNPKIKWKSEYCYDIHVTTEKECTYHIMNLSNITYDPLELWDDKEGYKVTHEVCIETKPTDRPGPQYWVDFTITDAAGKTSSLRKRLIIENAPSKEDTADLEECEF